MSYEIVCLIFVSSKNSKVTSIDHSIEMSQFLMQAFVLLTSTTFPSIPLQSNILSNHTSRPIYNDISHEQCAQQVANHKPSLIYNILHFAYPYQNTISSQRIGTIPWHERLLAHSWPVTQLTLMNHVNARKFIVTAT
jgi:hypothetical protein